MAILAAGLSLAASDARAANDNVAEAASTPSVQRFTEQGIAVDFSIVPSAGAKSLAPREGDDVIVRFKLSSVADGAPVRGVQPAAWIDRLPAGGKISPQATRAKTQAFLQGGTFGKAYADLNVYYVLVMNEDNTISVVDPLFGFGGSKLLAYVRLNGRGEDWVLSSDQRNLYVSMPEASAVAVVDTTTWSVVANIATGQQPSRLALQPDQHYLWIADLGSGSEATDRGVTVVAAEDRSIKAHIATGKGPCEIVFSEDSRTAFVLNRGSGTLSVIDVPSLRKLSDIPVGKKPVGLDHCAKSGSVFATDEESGQIVVVDARRRTVLTTIKAEPGLGQIKFLPNGQFGFAVNPKANLLHIIDSASNRVVQTGDMEKEPFQISFSDRLAYIRHRQTATVLMVPLDGIGAAGKPVPVVDFEGGQASPGEARYPSSAASLVQAPGTSGVLVANERDKAVYYYEEGMAAVKGEFSNYGHFPRAVLPVDRTLRERSRAGSLRNRRPVGRGWQLRDSVRAFFAADRQRLPTRRATELGGRAPAQDGQAGGARRHRKSSDKGRPAGWDRLQSRRRAEQTAQDEIGEPHGDRVSCARRLAEAADAPGDGRRSLQRRVQASEAGHLLCTTFARRRHGAFP